MADKSKILIIGGTGYIGKFIVEASAKAGHPTFALVRESTVSDPVKGKLVENFKNLGVTLIYVRNCTYKLLLPCFSAVVFLVLCRKRNVLTVLYSVRHLQGDIYGHGNLVKAIKQVDVVISAIGNMQIVDQTKIIAAIKEAGNVKVGP